jgi:hypothetical protein
MVTSGGLNGLDMLGGGLTGIIAILLLVIVLGGLAAVIIMRGS